MILKCALRFPSAITRVTRNRDLTMICSKVQQRQYKTCAVTYYPNAKNSFVFLRRPIDDDGDGCGVFVFVFFRFYSIYSPEIAPVAWPSDEKEKKETTIIIIWIRRPKRRGGGGANRAKFLYVIVTPYNMWQTTMTYDSFRQTLSRTTAHTFSLRNEFSTGTQRMLFVGCGAYRTSLGHRPERF